MGNAVRRSIRVRRPYVIAAALVPMTLESLFVPSDVAGGSPGSAMSSDGSCTSPPPPVTASTHPAHAAATHSSAIVPGSRPIMAGQRASPW